MTDSAGQSDYYHRFGGIGRLYGRDGLERLRASHVCVIGVGGVGSWAVEALARSGVGAITMVDLDDVCVTNTNRQLHAMDGNIGRPKVDALTDRMRLINPGIQLESACEFFTEGSADRLLAPGYSFVIDAIDKLSNKCLVIAECRQRSLPVITVGGAGGRRESTGLHVCDLAESQHDELLRQVRRKLRRDHGFPRERGGLFGVQCVYSEEDPVFPWSDGRACATAEPGSDLTLDCSSGFGTATFVTGAFGFAAAGEVVRRIALAVS